MINPTAEIPESTAPPAIAAIYSDIRAATGVGMVNLIFRRLATDPTLLSAVWTCLGPLFHDGSVRRFVAQLEGTLPLPEFCPLPPSSFSALRMSNCDRDAITRIIRDYNVGNSGNLLALTTLHRALSNPDTAMSNSSGRATGVDDRTSDEAPKIEAPSPLPPILDLSAMSDELVALVRSLAIHLPPTELPIIPSLYRHLAHWPAYLALAKASLSSLDAQNVLAPAVTHARDMAARAADALTANLGDREPLNQIDSDEKDALIAMLSAYTDAPIAGMIVNGYILERMLPKDV